MRIYDCWIRHYYVSVHNNDEVFVSSGLDGLLAKETADGLARFVSHAKDLRVGWSKFPDDGDEVIYLYDRGDRNFGYAVNLNDPNCSEWGYAPFPIAE